MESNRNLDPEPTEAPGEAGGEVEAEEHPRGALTLALGFGVLLIVIWLTVYFNIFVPRG